MFAIVLENVGMAYRSTFNVFEGWICTGRHEKLDHLTVAVFCCDVKRALAAGVDRVDDGTALEEKLGAREPTLEHFKNLKLTRKSHLLVGKECEASVDGEREP